jgi:hypothetical protein
MAERPCRIRNRDGRGSSYVLFHLHELNEVIGWRSGVFEGKSWHAQDLYPQG